MEEGGGHSRASRDAQPPDPCPCDGEDFAHLGPRHGKGGKSWVIYSLAVGVTILQTFSDSWEDNSPEPGPLWGGGLVHHGPPPLPCARLCPLPLVTPAAGGQAGWRVPPPAPGKCRGVLLRVLLCTGGAGRPVFSGGSTRV